MVTSSTICAVLAATIALAFAPTKVDARPQYITQIPNGANVNGVAALGHFDTSGGGDLNVFGSAFENAGYKWTRELCEGDADGDGQTNGQELGDPCCEWSEGKTPRWTSGLSHPGDKTKKSDASNWADVKCEAKQSKTDNNSNDNAGANALLSSGVIAVAACVAAQW